MRGRGRGFPAGARGGGAVRGRGGAGGRGRGGGVVAKIFGVFLTKIFHQELLETEPVRLIGDPA